jgi:hypothetical protein
MPTLQMIFRISNRQLLSVKDYLTGTAHPTVFEGGWVDPVKMVERAHAIRLDNIPPVAMLKVLTEDEPVNGRDYFESGKTEKLADTLCAIARIWRGGDYTRRMVVSAESSVDVNHRPLTFHWVVLRGDAQRVKILPVNRTGSIAEIVISYHPRRPVTKRSTLESNRVDIGAFVHNGVYYSAPSFVTFFALDDEARTYDADGRLLEIGYGMGETTLAVTDWLAMLDMLDPSASAPGAGFLRKAFSEKQLAHLSTVREEYKKALEAAATSAAPGGPDAVTKAAEGILARRPEGQHSSARDLVLGALNAMMNDPSFYSDNARAIASLSKDCDRDRQAAVWAGRQRLIDYGVLKKASDKAFIVLPILGASGCRQSFKASVLAASQPMATTGPTGTAGGLTAFEKCLVQRFNADVLSLLVYPGAVTCSFKRNYVSPVISSAKSWRDVYHYDPAGKCTGWTRYSPEGVVEFDAAGAARAQ